MKLTFLGCGSGYTPQLRNTNAYFVKDDTFFLIDCGFTTFDQLIRLEDFTKVKKFVILLTHLHADHCGSLSMTISYSFNILKRVPTLIFPLTTVVDLLTLMGIPSEQYVLKSEMQKIEGIVVQPVEVQHTPLMRCFGYVLEDEEKSIYYSGDSSLIPQNIIKAFHDSKINELYQDTTYIKGEHPSHATLDYLDAVIQSEFKHKVYCMHLDYDFKEEVEMRGYQVVYCYTANKQMS